MMAIPTEFAIEHTCGHTQTRDLSNVDAGKRKSRADWYSKNQTCAKCFKASKDSEDRKDTNQRAIDAAAFANDHGLPELKGSDAQVKWASIIRAEALEVVVDEHQDAPAVIEAAKAITHAGWWMDNLGWDDQKKYNYGADEFAELILTGPAAQAERDATSVENENPF